jgi:hypothetical protein
MSTHYWICQHIADPFRREPRNVGVIARKEGTMGARFLGQNRAGELDGRTLRGRPDADAYRQWVRFWTRAVERQDLGSILQAGGSHYQVVDGGDVTDTGEDHVLKVVKYLFEALVSEGGFSEALNPDPATATRRLEREVSHSFREMRLLSSRGPELGLPHPIEYKAVNVSGKSEVAYTPTFVQQNGKLSVFEPIDLTSPKRALIEDRAGNLAYMFDDIREARHDLEPIALVRAEPNDLENRSVRIALRKLENEAQVIFWNVEEARDEFLRQRAAVARSL